MTPHVQTFFDKATSTATHLVSDPATRVAAVIDPVLDFEPKAARLSTGSADAVLAAVHEQGLTLAYVLETHAHADHLSAADYIRRETGAQVVIGAEITQVQKAFIPRFEADDVADDGRVFDRLLAEGDVLPLGSLDIGVLHTPGHTPACVTYMIGDAAFVGDTLFMPDYGTARADFPGGDAATLYRSTRKILALPETTRIFVGHDYLPAGRDTFAWQTTVAEQRARNVHVHDGVDEAAFVAMREARDATLAAPTLILPSLQVNIRAGALPPATAAGNVFLRLPVTQA
ncbi:MULTISPECIES: MBL fold metallo-hydrolase [unclassified Phenylobacterium]|uniref:MBL fold metallo-hydrolase n=1 Tax=unclassified Phenylobacterium TaxID=2640670 RepID=UPI0022B44B57|nr:MBL fold metallo-hydrolase [Phenylobacterium sp. NIBR 498073]MBS0489192.1 MBL fold metallo-hydrolase [Pseudomonadota bacterium]WGU40375.1 MBL fold metallo-hydrolase [Phenylobacterium sp. NIBR 498073]